MHRLFCGMAALLTGALVFSAGCGESTPSMDPAPAGSEAHDDHDHAERDQAGHHGDHDHPHTYAEGVKQADELHTTVRESLAAGEEDKADVALHELGHMLEHLPELAKKHALSDEAIGEVKQAVDQLLDDFGKIDEKLHGGEGAAYDEVAERIDAAMQQLKKHVGE